MTKVIDAIFDGEVFRPSEVVDLEPNTPVQVHFDDGKAIGNLQQESTPKSLQEWIDRYAGTFEEPEDWSEEHDHYLYGTPKRDLTI